MRRHLSSMVLVVVLAPGTAQESPADAIPDVVYRQQVRHEYSKTEGLPSPEVHAIELTSAGRVYAGTARGLARFEATAFRRVESIPAAPCRQLAARGSELLVAVEGKVHLLADDGSSTALAAWPEGVRSAEDLRGLEVSTRARDRIYLATQDRIYVRTGAGWEVDAGLRKIVGESPDIRAIALNPGTPTAQTGALAVACRQGLLVRHGERWRFVRPRAGQRSWDLHDVRAVGYSADGRLWFASPQGCGIGKEGWQLFTAADGLPYDDFTALATGPLARAGEVWLGTRRGAIHFDGRTWEYRCGRRWLPADHVRDLTVDARGEVWFATQRGVGRIELREMQLARKAEFFEAEIDARHRRTEYGFVLDVIVDTPGDKSRWRQHDSDNDGLWTSMYGAGQCFAYAATRRPEYKRRALQAFRALEFLGTVTQGGSHPAPHGFVARTILPTTGRNPNDGRIERDRRFQATRDRLWKIIDPRWPVSQDGKWYWKADTSSDELDGHYFFYAQFFDHVAESAEERRRVRRVVASLTDHLVKHDFNLVDHDGRPTRWGHFSPADLNHNRDWWEERGLNSLSILSYLKVASHITGDEKYEKAATRLVRQHSYLMNVMNPKNQSGPGTGNQSDDEMAFMNFYNILKYEKNPERRQVYAHAFWRYWRLEQPELNPLFNFLFAGVSKGERWRDAWGEEDLSPTGAWLSESLDTLRRYPLDRFDWRCENRHRKDVRLLAPGEGTRGGRQDGTVLPIDERFVNHWNHDPWRLDTGGQGRVLADGASFLLPYYLGLHHGFIVEAPK